MSDRLSVIIVNWNTCDDLRRCLGALREHPYTLGASEVIVIDNGSVDGSARMVSGGFPNTVLIVNAENELYAHATNQGLERATGDYLLLLNPDAQVQTGTLDTLVRVARHPPDTHQAHALGAVAPRLQHADGTTQRSVRDFPSPGAILWDLLKQDRLFPRFGAGYRLPRFDYNRDQLAPQPMASCFLIPRASLRDVGLMDERFPLYFNDADWCKRCWTAGRIIWYTAQTSVVHGYGGTTRKVRRAAIWESHRALLRYWHKHHAGMGWPLYTLLTILVTLGAWARTGRWGDSLGKWGGETTPADLRRQLEREG